jgi:hypothetical protein
VGERRRLTRVLQREELKIRKRIREMMSRMITNKRD